MRTRLGVTKLVLSAICLSGLLTVSSIPGFAREKNETIDATAWGTSTQMGKNIGITVII